MFNQLMATIASLMIAGTTTYAVLDDQTAGMVEDAKTKLVALQAHNDMAHVQIATVAYTMDNNGVAPSNMEALTAGGTYLDKSKIQASPLAEATDPLEGWFQADGIWFKEVEQTTCSESATAGILNENTQCAQGVDGKWYFAVKNVG